MTNAELIKEIRAEIERLKGIGGIVPLDNREQKTGYESALFDVETFLSTLESEKPINQEGLEEEMDEFFETMPVLEHENIFDVTFQKIARHFAQWGAEHLKK